MSKVLQRLLVFFIGLPVILGLVCIDSLHHIVLNIAIVATASVAALETACLVKLEASYKKIIIILASLLPFATYLFIYFGISFAYIQALFIVITCFIFCKEILCAKDFRPSIVNICSSVFCVFYSGYLLTYLSRLTTTKHSRIFIILFLIMVFICDSAAWLFGVLFGAKNKNIFRASPNKSVAGFLGGYVACIVCALGAKLLYPQVFNTSYIAMCFFGIIIATTSIVGDLAESVLKRSAGLKDSGTIIPGRGGLLDSIDSIVIAIPFYYFGLKLFGFV